MERKEGEYYYIWDRGKYPIYQHHDNAPDKWIDTCYKRNVAHDIYIRAGMFVDHYYCKKCGNEQIG